MIRYHIKTLSAFFIKTKSLKIIILIFSLGLTFSVQSQSTTESDVQSQIQDITKEYNKTWETLNVEEIAKFHSDKSFLYYWRGQLASRNNEHFRKLFPEILSATKSWTITKSSEPLVQVISEDAAIISFTLETVVDMDGKKSPGGGTLTYVWSKVDGKWKISHIHDTPKNCN
jgi:ketosteroid isomerase-like protein